ncbi:hypothetical protein HQ520_16160 [bacterium]|nr:hypothetical protein [bacterium]
MALVQTLDSASVVLTGGLSDIEGSVRLARGESARSLRVEAMGYAVAVEALSGPDVTVRLATQPLEVAGLIVEVESRSGLSQFSRRREAGRGLFLDPFDVHLKSKYGVREVFRDLDKVRRTDWSSRGPRIVSGLGRGCFSYRLNNLPVRVEWGRNPWETYPLDGVLPGDLMAVEIYRYFGEVPEELQHNAGIGGDMCGLIVIWTREGWGGGGD